MLLASLAGCNTKIARVDMDGTRLVPSTTRADQFLVLCDYRLGEVVDERHDGVEAGGLSAHAFTFRDAADVVRKQLLHVGVFDDPAVVAPTVSVHILQLYLTQNLETKVPVAVYRVAIGDEAPFVLRSQKASLNWNGTEDEAYAAYARTMADVTSQLVEQLNRRCHGR